MCLTINTAKHPITPAALIAQEDMEVYKVLEIDNKSTVQSFQYHPNTLYTLSKPLAFLEVQDGGINHQVGEGFHAYYDLRNSFMLWNFMLQKPENAGKLKFVKFTIPKGTKFYYGIYYDVVAETIRSGDLTPITTNNLYIKKY